MIISKALTSFIYLLFLISDKLWLIDNHLYIFRHLLLIFDWVLYWIFQYVGVIYNLYTNSEILPLLDVIPRIIRLICVLIQITIHWVVTTLQIIQRYVILIYYLRFYLKNWALRIQLCSTLLINIIAHLLFLSHLRIIPRRGLITVALTMVFCHVSRFFLRQLFQIQSLIIILLSFVTLTSIRLHRLLKIVDEHVIARSESALFIFIYRLFQ